MTAVALYARVSSERQAQTDTIASQIADVQARIGADGYRVLDERAFIDNGYSGTSLTRPGLEKLRDAVARGEIDKIYIHSPDRLSRKYVYQMLILEEFSAGGAEVIFLNHPLSENPENQLLLQMQGMIAEYERVKIMERNRRGKLHAARQGAVSALCGAPYGYRYIKKQVGNGQAFYEVHTEEADIVRKIFAWAGHDRYSCVMICRLLQERQVLSPTGRPTWSKGVISSLLKNTAYKGQAAFGKKKSGKARPRLRPLRHANEYPKKNISRCMVDSEQWIYIPVPALVEEALFDQVQEQLAENKKRMRARLSGTPYLLQGLVVCQCCQYAYSVAHYRKTRAFPGEMYYYYRCVSHGLMPWGAEKICKNKSVRMEALDTAVWEEVKQVLNNPQRIVEEYQRRIQAFAQSPLDPSKDTLEKQIQQLKRGMERLVDSYTQEHIEQDAFERRIKAMKQRLKILEEHQQKTLDHKKLQGELTLIMTNVENFSSNIHSRLENIEWLQKRQIIRALVKRIEIGIQQVQVVFRIQELPTVSDPSQNQRGQENLQYCHSGHECTVFKNQVVTDGK